jgi:DNA-binding transcriptional MocR family regulator
MSQGRQSSFNNKWGDDLQALGYTAVPNCLLTCQAQLGIASCELNILLQVLSFKFDTRHPFPSLRAISKQTGLAVNTIRRNLRSLENKGMIKRLYRTGDTNLYDIEPLIRLLEDHPYCKGVQKRSSLPPRVYAQPRPETDAKEDLLQITPNNKTLGSKEPKGLPAIFEEENNEPINLADIPF